MSGYENLDTLLITREDEVVTYEQLEVLIAVADQGPRGVPGLKGDTVLLGFLGDLSVSPGECRWYPRTTVTLQTFEAWVGVAPVGAGVMFVVKKNGNSVATGSVAEGENKMVTQTGLNVDVTPADYLTADVTQVGSTETGKNLSIRLEA